MKTIVYDGECDFCKWALLKLPAEVQRHYEFTKFSELTEAQQELLPEEYTDCFHVIVSCQNRKRVYSCGAALQEIFSGNPCSLRYTIVRSRVSSKLFEKGYHLIADNRGKFGKYVNSP